MFTYSSFQTPPPLSLPLLSNCPRLVLQFPFKLSLLFLPLPFPTLPFELPPLSFLSNYPRLSLPFYYYLSISVYFFLDFFLYYPSSFFPPLFPHGPLPVFGFIFFLFTIIFYPFPSTLSTSLRFVFSPLTSLFPWFPASFTYSSPT